MCYYRGKVIRQPTLQHPYYTVLYTEGIHNPNGQIKCQEEIHQAEFYKGGGDGIRNRHRVLRNELVDVLNNRYVTHKMKTGVENLLCFPLKATESWNQSLLDGHKSSAENSDANYQQRMLRHSILSDLFQNTFVNVRLRHVNSAPSVLSDSHTPPTQSYAHEELFLDTNGCRPRLPHTDSHVAIHPNACRMRYRFAPSVSLEMHLLGSDESGASLTIVFQQCIEGLHQTITAAFGENQELKKCLNTMRIGLKHYARYRKRIRNQQLLRTLNPLKNGKIQKNLVYAMYERQRELMEMVKPEAVSDKPHHQRKFNRMFLLPLVRNRKLKVSNTNAIASFVSDHDCTLSVGHDNEDITTEVSFAAKQSTTTTRLASRANTSHKQMLSNTLQDTQLRRKDNYFLSVWLHIFCVEVAPKLLSTITSTPTTPSLSEENTEENHADIQDTKSSFADSASPYVLNCIGQLFSILSTEPIHHFTSDALFNQLRKDIVSNAAATIKKTVHQLFVKYIYNETQMVNSAEWQHKQVIGTSPTNGKNMQLQMPWNSVVFGASLVAHYEVRHKYAFTTYKPQSSTNLHMTITRTRHTSGSDQSGWQNVVYAHMNKQISVANTLPTTFMNQLLIGQYAFASDVYVHLNHDPLFASHSENIRESYDNSYYNLSKYKSAKTGKCFLVKCQQTESTVTPEPCCKSVDDISDCKRSVVQEINCMEPPRIRRAKIGRGKCHTKKYNTDSCGKVFHNRIQNCRNGLLIIEPFDEKQGLAPFWEYITHRTESGVRLRLLNKMVKTLVLQVNDFGLPGLATMPSVLNQNPEHLELLHKMQRALTFLYKYYIVVGLHAPASLSVPDNQLDTTMMQSIKHTDEEGIDTLQYESYNCVNITFRRKYENSQLFYHHSLVKPLKSIASLRHRAQYNPIVFRELLSPLVHPAMLNTIMAFKWKPEVDDQPEVERPT